MIDDIEWAGEEIPDEEPGTWFDPPERAGCAGSGVGVQPCACPSRDRRAA